MRDLNVVAEQLFNEIRGRFPSVTIGDGEGNTTNEPSQARFYEFDFKSLDNVLGKVSVSLDEKSGVTIMYNKDFTEDVGYTEQEDWYNFLKGMRVFAKKRLLNFEVRDFSEKRQKILDNLIKLKKEFAPDEVLTPSRFDIHQDHQTITNEAVRAFKTCTILGYEIPWNCLRFDLDYFVELSQESIYKKVDALNLYKSQLDRFYFRDNYMLNHAKSRGGLINATYAEVFEIIRIVNRIN